MFRQLEILSGAQGRFECTLAVHVKLLNLAQAIVELELALHACRPLYLLQQKKRGKKITKTSFCVGCKLRVRFSLGLKLRVRTLPRRSRLKLGILPV